MSAIWTSSLALRLVVYMLLIALAVIVLMWAATQFGAWLGRDVGGYSSLQVAIHSGGRRWPTQQPNCPAWFARRHLCGGLW